MGMYSAHDDASAGFARKILNRLFQGFQRKTKSQSMDTIKGLYIISQLGINRAH